MAESRGIAEISGVDVENIASENEVSKANIWEIGGGQRETSLFRALLNSGLTSYADGKNDASFSAQSDGRNNGMVYFAYTSNRTTTTYNFTLTISGLVRTGWNISASSTASFGTDVIVSSRASNGALNINLSPRVSATTIYLGLWVDPSARNVDQISVQNLIVTAS